MASTVLRNLFSKHPLGTNMVIYGTLYVGAEFSQQVITNKYLVYKQTGNVQIQILIQIFIRAIHRSQLTRRRWVDMQQWEHLPTHRFYLNGKYSNGQTHPKQSTPDETLLDCKYSNIDCSAFGNPAR